jgi:hypothetical protein
VSVSLAPLIVKRPPGGQANLEERRVTSALEKKAIMPRPEMTPAGVGENGIENKIKR